MEAQQQPTTTLMTKQLTVKILEEVDPDVEWAGLSRRKVMSNLAHYEQLLYEKRREATQATLDVTFLRVSLPEVSANKVSPTSDELPASDKPQLSTSMGGFTNTDVQSPSSSDADDPDIV